MSIANWLANKVMNWLSQNANDAGDAQVDMKGQSISVKELRRIERDWIDAGIIR
ncbi:MAG: hypothetical protein PHU34_11330 [Candidatus Methanoperedens sp.]|nr:hypothetical protein [Candidatus Methanoperedens sp.]